MITMATFTVSIPKDLKEEIAQYPEINLAEYLKKRFQLRVNELLKFEALKNKGVLYHGIGNVIGNQ